MRIARRKALSRAMSIRFCSFDVENLPFRDSVFPAVLSSLVFCTVNDPRRGLSEIHRVLEPSGMLYMIEHVRPCSIFAGRLFDLLNRISVPLIGDHLNRSTCDTVRSAGFRMTRECRCGPGGVFRIIVARKA